MPPRNHRRREVNVAFPFTDEQHEALREWLAAGEAPRAILARIAAEDARHEGAAPWPRGVTASLIRSYREEIKSAVALVQLDRQEAALVWGLGDRSQLAAYQEQTLSRTGQLIEDVGNHLARLINDGALQLTEAELTLPEETAGAIAPPAGTTSGVDMRQLAIKNELFGRAISLGKLYAALIQQNAKQVEVMGRLTAAIDLDRPIDLRSRIERGREALESVIGRLGGQPSEVADAPSEERRT